MTFAEQFKKAAEKDKNAAAEMLVQETDLERNSFLNFLFGYTPPLKQSFSTVVNVQLQSVASVSFNDEGKLNVQNAGDGDHDTKEAVELAYEKLKAREKKDTLASGGAQKTPQQLLEDVQSGQELPSDISPEQMQKLKEEIDKKLLRTVRLPSLVP